MGALLLDTVLVGFLMGMLHHGFHLQLLVLAIYGAVMWKLRGSTVGGIVFDLHVVRLDDRAGDLVVPRLFARVEPNPEESEPDNRQR
jgi:hypothetical protein